MDQTRRLQIHTISLHTLAGVDDSSITIKSVLYLIHPSLLTTKQSGRSSTTRPTPPSIISHDSPHSKADVSNSEKSSPHLSRETSSRNVKPLLSSCSTFLKDKKQKKSCVPDAALCNIAVLTPASPQTFLEGTLPPPRLLLPLPPLYPPSGR